jgi:HAD superfamily hydrolase (TIGR01490 family)
VFFDVDHTLITGSSMGGSFAELARTHWRSELVSSMADLAVGAEQRDQGELLADAISLLRGERWSSAMKAGQAWYEREGAAQFVPLTLQRLRHHQRKGDDVVLVSGSWLPALVPIARTLRVSRVLCSMPEVKDGVLTGRLPYPVVGPGKVRAIHDFVRRHGLPLDNAVAYGDDPSDVPMLELAAHPVVVGANPVMAEVARIRGWEHLRTAVRRV